MSNAPKTGVWQWWASRDAEIYTVGPEDSREAIIQAARGDELGFNDDEGAEMLTFYIVEARQDPLQLSTWVPDDMAERLLELADESYQNTETLCEVDEPPFFPCSDAQRADLQKRIEQACADWQAAHGLVFRTKTFTATRNEELLTFPLTPDETPEGKA